MTSRSGKTAFVMAGGGSLGAIQVGMLTELLRAGETPDLVVGSSVGALNASMFAAYPNAEGVDKLARIWCSLKRSDIFPVTMRSALAWMRGSGSLFDSSGLRELIETNLPFRSLEQAQIPLHVVATNLGGVSVCLSKGPSVDSILASAAIPIAFPSVRIGNDDLIDGAIGSNTPIVTAMELGAKRIIVLPTGFACSLDAPPMSAVARGLHALTLLVAHQVVSDLRLLAGTVEIHIVPSLCPLNISPFNFEHSASLIELAAQNTREWISAGGLTEQKIPGHLHAHLH